MRKYAEHLWAPPISKLSSEFQQLPMEVRAHSIRVGICAQILWDAVQGTNETTDLSVAVCTGGQYHDIGKTMLSQELLRKMEAPTQAEQYALNQHPVHTGELIESQPQSIFQTPESRQIILNMGRYHHERYDGKGYPYKLSGKEIPLEAQLCALADYCDHAVTAASKGQKAAYQEVKEKVIEWENIRFSPEAVRAFCLVQEKIWRMYQQRRSSVGK